MELWSVRGQEERKHTSPSVFGASHERMFAAFLRSIGSSCGLPLTAAHGLQHRALRQRTTATRAKEET